MEWLRFEGLERSYGARRIFADVAGDLADGKKVGLVGPNGAGKSSLVRILVGSETPDAGRIVRARDARVGYLEQAASEERNATLRVLLEGAFARIHADEARIRELEVEMSAAGDDTARLERALHAYGEAREAFDRHGGEGLERRMRSMVAEFGFGEDDLDRPTSAFSGGQRTRAALARMFLEEPDFLILDEPTNHLDLETVRWLETFLNDDPRAALVVSHDRFFLDRVANEIWELDRGTLTRYVVPQGRAYAAYIEEKEARAELERQTYERALAEEKRREAVIAELRTHGSHNYAQVRSREKQVAKFDRVRAPEVQPAKISVALEASRRATSGYALEAKGLSKSFEHALFTKLTFDVARGERLAIVGPNGAGKSTLLAILAGRLAADRGTVRIPEGVKFAWFSQDTADDLPAGVAAVDAVLEGATITPQRARELLGRLRLGGEAADKPVEAFSGGERRRIMLARLMARSADLLFLDEPTNDLDIASREALEDVLAAYAGAIVVASHDRYLLARLAQRVLLLHDGTATVVDDDYERFEERQHKRENPKPEPAKAPPARGKKAETVRADKPSGARDIAAVEREVAQLDAERAKLAIEFADPKIYDDTARLSAMQRKLAETETLLGDAYARWESLMETV